MSLSQEQVPTTTENHAFVRTPNSRPLQTPIEQEIVNTPATLYPTAQTAHNCTSQFNGGRLQRRHSWETKFESPEMGEKAAKEMKDVLMKLPDDPAETHTFFQANN